MNRMTFVLVVVFLIGFAVPSGAQVNRDTLNGWYPQVVSSGITRLYQKNVPNASPFTDYLGKNSQLWGMKLPVGEVVKFKKKFGKEFKIPLSMRYDVRYNTASMSLSDSSSFFFSFFFSHGDTVKWFTGVEFRGPQSSMWYHDFPISDPLIDVDKIDEMIADSIEITEFDAIGIRFWAVGKDLELAELILDNLILVYDSSGIKTEIKLEDFEDAGIAKGAIEFPTGVRNFGAVEKGWRKVALLKATNIGLGTLNVTGVVTTDSAWSVTPSTATILPGDSIIFSVAFQPEATTESGKIQYLIFSHNGIKGVDSVAVTGDVTTGIDEEKTGDTPGSYSLGQNYPNPFNPTTSMKFTIPKAGMVNFTIYNILGQEVRTLIRESMSAGLHEVVFDGRNNFGEQLASGVYVYQIHSENFVMARKMALTK